MSNLFYIYNHVNYACSNMVLKNLNYKCKAKVIVVFFLTGQDIILYHCIDQVGKDLTIIFGATPGSNPVL